MNQIKIGKFIAECRRRNNLTQMQLAEKLNITDRAISKWENGKSMPDYSYMLDLCNELKISVNELLSGEKIEVNQYNEKAEQNLLHLKRQKEENDKILLTLEIGIGLLSGISLFMLVFVASFVEMATLLRILLIVIGFIPFIFGMIFAVKIEQIAGYYQCENCYHKYIPSYKKVLFSLHTGRTRYMKCPHCRQKTWNKKII